MLLTVLLLDLFESLAGKDQNSLLKSEAKHIDGAIALVKLRGKEQFHDPIGIRMFLQLSINVMTRCLYHEVEMLPELVCLRDYAAQFIDATDPKWRFPNVMIQYAKLRAMIRTGEWSDDRIGRFGTELDGDLLSICNSMPSDWQFLAITPSVQSAHTFEGSIHVYPSHNVCKSWNTIRVVRILLNEIIQGSCQRLLTSTSFSPNPDTPYQIKDCINTILSMSSDICAAVPQYMDCSLDFRAQVPKDGQFSTQDRTAYDRAGALGLIFPLYVAASSSVCPEHMREWIIGRLHMIGSQMGIPQALFVKGMVEKRERGNPWAIAAMVRCLSF